MACKVVGDSVTSLRFLSEKQYKQYGFDAANPTNASHLVRLMMYLQNKTYGTESFVVHDARLIGMPSYADSTQEQQIRFRAVRGEANRTNKTGIAALYAQVEVCYAYDYYGCSNPAHIGQLCGETDKIGYHTINQCQSYSIWLNGESSGTTGGSTPTSGGGSTGSVSTKAYLQQILGLTDAESAIFESYPGLAEETYNYCINSDGAFTELERKKLAISHTLLLSSNPEYTDYCTMRYEENATLKSKKFPWFRMLSLQDEYPDQASNIQQLKLNAQQAYYLLNNTNNNSSLAQYLLSYSNDEIYKLLSKESLNEAIQGKPFNLPVIWVNHVSTNNVKRIIVNLLQNKCLEQVFNTITKESYTNNLSSMIRVFDANENATVVIREDPSLEPDTYGSCKGVLDDAGNVKFYLIKLNPNALLDVSEEIIANTMFHEFIHAYLKDNLSKWDFENNSAHNQMLNTYIDAMANALNSIFGLSLRDAYCLAYSGLFDDEDDVAYLTSTIVRSAVRQKLLVKFNNDPTFVSDEAIRNKRNDYLKNGSLGTRTNNCQ